MDPSPPIRPISHRRDCLIALCAGAVLFLIAFTAGKSVFALGRVSFSILILLAISSSVAAGVAAGSLPLAGLPKEAALPLAGKTGVRTGLLTAFLGAGMTVMGVHTGGTANPYLVWLPGILSVMPGALAGIAAAALVGSNRGNQSSEAPPPMLVESENGALWIAGAVTLGIFGLLSPLFLPSGFPKPAPFVPEVAKNSTPFPPAPQASEPVSITPPPPPFEFKPNPELFNSPPESWTLAHVKTIPEMDASQDAPASLSPDGRYLACVKSESDGKAVQLIRLLTLKNERTWRLNQTVSQICFAPDGDRLFLMGSGQSPPLSVIKLDRSLVELPAIEPGPPSDATVDWLDDNTVGFFRSGRPAVLLNLDSLLMEPDDKRSFGERLHEGKHWRFTGRMVCRSALVPSASGAVSNWPVSRSLCLGVEHPTEGIARLFPGEEIREGDRLLAASDGSVLVRIGRGGAQAYYFDRREPPKLGYEILMPHEPEKFPESSPLRDATNHSNLRVMVYPPLHNPLTGKVVGPDRGRILGRARILTWEGNRARVRMLEMIDSLPVESVFADLHIEQNGGIDLVEIQAPHRWWTPAGAESASDTQTAPPAAQTDSSVSFKFHRGAFMVAMEQTKARYPTAAVSRTNDSPSSASSIEQRIREFVIAHHQKASRGDVSGEVADYADRVDFFTHGTISREKVFEDQKNYHSRYKSDETVSEPIDLRPAGQGLFRVNYLLTSRLSDRGAPPATVLSDVSLLIQDSAAGLRITSHHSKPVKR